MSLLQSHLRGIMRSLAVWAGSQQSSNAQQVFQSTVEFQAGFCLTPQCLEIRRRVHIAPAFRCEDTFVGLNGRAPSHESVLQGSTVWCTAVTSSSATDQRPLLEGLSRFEMRHFDFFHFRLHVCGLHSSLQKTR